VAPAVVKSLHCIHYIVLLSVIMATPRVVLVHIDVGVYVAHSILYALVLWEEILSKNVPY
jgi:hypothetical protein